MGRSWGHHRGSGPFYLAQSKEAFPEDILMGKFSKRSTCEEDRPAGEDISDKGTEGTVPWSRPRVRG